MLFGKPLDLKTSLSRDYDRTPLIVAKA